MCDHVSQNRVSLNRISQNRVSRRQFANVLFSVVILSGAPARERARGEREALAPTSKISEDIVVTDAWTRPALKGGTGGAYMTITNKGRSIVRVVSAASSDARSTELHTSMVQNGMAHMEMLPQLVITPGASVSLKPGGTHFMLVGLRRAFVKGDTARLTLRFQSDLSAGTNVVVNVVVRTQ